MTLRLLLPTRVLLDRVVTKVVAEGREGSFCLLPRHLDYASALVPGLLLLTGSDGVETVAAVDEGVLVKCGADVLVSVRRAVVGDDLRALRRLVDDEFRQRDEHAQAAHAAIARLEAGVIRRFVELEAARR